MPKILIADDDPLIRCAVVRELRTLGQIVEAAGGLEAVALLDQHDDLDAVISDLEMPGMFGDEVLGHVRDRAPRCVRILISGACDQRLAEVTTAEYIVRKPWVTGEVRELVQARLRDRAVEQASEAPQAREA